MGKRALVMSGGGARGSFELGAVDYLVNDMQLDFDVIAGVSVGSLNAVMLAQGMGREGLESQLEALKQLWFGIAGDRDIYRKRFLGQLMVFLFKDSMYDPKPLRKKLELHVDEQALATSGKQFRIGVVSLESGRYLPIDQQSGNIHQWTLASSSMPLAFPPVKVADKHTVDGGIRNVTPLKDAFKALKQAGGGQPNDPDEMYILLASPLDASERGGTKWKNGRTIGLRALEIITNEIFREDISYALAINRSVRAFVATEKMLRERNQLDQQAQDLLDSFPFKPPKYNPVDVYAVVPEIEHMDTLSFDPQKIQQAFQAGREAAVMPLDEEDLEKLLG